MNKKLVVVALRWLQRVDDGALSDLRAFELFLVSYASYKEKIDEFSKSRIESDLQDFDTRGLVPSYVSRFLREIVFPRFISHTRAAEGDLPCISETHS